MEDEPPIPIPDNMSDPVVYSSFQEKASEHEARRLERVKKRKSQEQSFKEASGKLIASKGTVRRKTGA